MIGITGFKYFIRLKHSLLLLSLFLLTFRLRFLRERQSPGRRFRLLCLALFYCLLSWRCTAIGILVIDLLKAVALSSIGDDVDLGLRTCGTRPFTFMSIAVAIL